MPRSNADDDVVLDPQAGREEADLVAAAGVDRRSGATRTLRAQRDEQPDARRARPPSRRASSEPYERTTRSCSVAERDAAEAHRGRARAAPLTIARFSTVTAIDCVIVSAVAARDEDRRRPLPADAQRARAVDRRRRRRGRRRRPRGRPCRRPPSPGRSASWMVERARRVRLGRDADGAVAALAALGRQRRPEPAAARLAVREGDDRRAARSGGGRRAAARRRAARSTCPRCARRRSSGRRGGSGRRPRRARTRRRRRARARPASRRTPGR